ncbi:MAG: hypothetical protein MJE12_19800 [Alphaproteobacteria bacterium]|nr:hypothetical protein [Alphaproteobacteria bacterium]
MMNHYRFARGLGLPILLGLFVAGCANLPGAQFPVTVNTPPEQALISFKDPKVKLANTARVSHRGAFEHVEYALFNAPDLTVEAVYDVSLNNGLVLEYDYWLAKMVDTWNVNRGQNKIWGKSGSVRAWHGEIDYQLYRLAGSGRECAGFSSEWDYQPRDPFGRPQRVLFGYICANPGDKLPEQEVAALLQSTIINERPGDTFVPVNPRSRVDQLAFNTAIGAPGTAGGNAEFPFNFGTPYFEGEGDDGSDFGK